jgi:hypothetical protein
MPERVTVEQINAHLASGLKRVVLFGHSGQHWRVMAARHAPGGKMEVQFMECGDSWFDVEPGTRIDLTK